MIYIYKLKTYESKVVADIHAAEEKLMKNGAIEITDVRIIEDENFSTGKEMCFIVFIYYRSVLEIKL